MLSEQVEYQNKVVKIAFVVFVIFMLIVMLLGDFKGFNGTYLCQ